VTSTRSSKPKGIEIIHTPVRAPQANAIAECLDWLLILNRRHLERVLRVFVHHYNGHRPHRSLNLTPPNLQQARPRLVRSPRPNDVERRDRLGGLIHEYSFAA
jgi:putative transposase